MFPREEVKGTPITLNLFPFFLFTCKSGLSCYRTVASFILVSNFCAFSTMKKSMPFLNRLLFLTSLFYSHSASSQDWKNNPSFLHSILPVSLVASPSCIPMPEGVKRLLITFFSHSLIVSTFFHSSHIFIFLQNDSNQTSLLVNIFVS